MSDSLADELIDIYDENNKPLGIQKMKSEAHRKGLWHRASHVWVYNSKGQMLLQRRAKDKETDPDRWDIAIAGHVAAGEDTLATAVREAKEEVDLSISPADLEHFGTVDEFCDNGRIINREHQTNYLFRFDGDIKTLRMQKEEVQDIKFFDLDLLEKDLAENPNRYASHDMKHWVEMIEAVRQKQSSK